MAAIFEHLDIKGFAFNFISSFRQSLQGMAPYESITQSVKTKIVSRQIQNPKFCKVLKRSFNPALLLLFGEISSTKESLGESSPRNRHIRESLEGDYVNRESQSQIVMGKASNTTAVVSLWTKLGTVMMLLLPPCPGGGGGGYQPEQLLFTLLSALLRSLHKSGV